MSTSKVTTVTLGAKSITRVASERGANFDFVNTQAVDQINQIFTKHGAGENNSFLCFWINEVVDRNTTKNTFAQRLNDFAALNQLADAFAAQIDQLLVDAKAAQ